MLLHSVSLRESLVQGPKASFIAGLLEAAGAEDVAGYLVNTLGGETLQELDPVDLLIRYLKKLSVRKLRLADFSPSKRTIERGEVGPVVIEFCEFLVHALDAHKEELPVIELD